ncbi:ATP-binding protein [Mariprofundus sp. EBB-1]|uniref:ATP-binding protein n=1 Tax=Mariprofundus sp. EBB-1 TaxID=2650971 RepID=UPI00137972AE|nr:ATP-binding protein [Mariprofundus sp. EBB-1]
MKNKFKFSKRTLIPLLIGLIFSGLLFIQVQQAEDKRLQSEFDAIANSYFILISHAWNSAYKNVSNFKQALENILITEQKNTVSPQTFNTLANMLPWKEKATLALAWVPLIKPEQREDFEKLVKKSPDSSFHIHDRSNNDNDDENIQNTTEDHNHYPIYLSRIVKSPDMIPGLDLSRIPEFSDAFSKAIMTDEPTTIHHDGDYDDNMPVFSIVSPIFLPHLKSLDSRNQTKMHLGFIVVDMDVGAMLENSLRDYPEHGIHLQVFDTHNGKEHLVYSYKTTLTESPISMEKSFVFIDSKVKLHFSASSAFLNMHSTKLRWVILFASILLTIFFTLLFAYLHEKRHIETHQRKLSTALEQSGQAILITNSDGIIEYVNPAFTKITGFEANEALGQNPKIIGSGQQDPSFYEDMWHTILSGKTWRGNIVDRRKDGSFYPASLTISPITNSDGKITHFVGTNEDLSAQKHLEEQLHQAQKMEAVGTLVGGVAHNFNNLLAGIMGKAYLGKSKASSPEKVKAYFSSIEQLSHRAADMVSQLLMFSREAQVEMKNIPFTNLMKETAKTAQIGVPENIKFIINFTHERLIVHGNATQLQQVLMNLVSNARDALSNQEQGTITVSLKASSINNCAQKDICKICTSQVATLVVEDTGNGISPINLPHIFEPFFTTKEVGRGTGLGLSTLYGTVESHAGVVTVKSKPGKGTTFTVCLPTIEIEAIESPEIESIQQATDHYTILVVDDDNSVLTTLEQLLSSLGYHVLTAHDGLQGIEVFKSHQDEISLMLTDIVMPNINGYMAVKEIREIKPQIPVLYITGYDKSSSMEKLQLDENTKLISKPFKLTDLSHAVYALLAHKLKT